MATYAAYRHIELDNIGYGKKRVLKPPGGGSSDIFGGNNESVNCAANADGRRIRGTKQHHQQQSSQLFLGSTNCSVASSSSSSSASSTASDHVDTPSNGVVGAAPSNGVAPKKMHDGNPVTGEGYEQVIRKPSTPVSNGTASSPPSTPSTAQTRQRVPPGGFSSGLW